MSTFPIDWNAWRGEWRQWVANHPLQPIRPFRPGKNLMADEILGEFNINGRKVELSEVTFAGKRYIGVTYESEAGPLVESFDELNRELGL